MSKLYIHKSFGVAPNDLLNNSGISLRAKGLFTYMQSKPDGWDFATNRMAKENKEGRDAIRKAAQELEDAGYLIRKTYNGDSGHWTTDYHLFSSPQPVERVPENPTSVNQASKKKNNKKEILYISYGKYGNVKLKEKTYIGLGIELGVGIRNKYIEAVDNYCEMHGKNYKNYAAAIRTFMKKGKADKKSNVQYKHNASDDRKKLLKLEREKEEERYRQQNAKDNENANKVINITKGLTDKFTSR